MIYLHTVKIEHVLDHAGVPKWRQQMPSLTVTPSSVVWTLATPARDRGVTREETRLFKSIRDECDDAGKKVSLLVMLSGLHRAITHQDYQEVVKGMAGLSVKSAYTFKYRNKSEKVWELKYQNKDRLYFFSFFSGNVEIGNLLIPMLFHHKKDQTTPEAIKGHCEKEMKPFLDPGVQITILKEKK